MHVELINWKFKGAH